MYGKINDKISEKLKTLPKSPGVYIMKDASGTVIYVGKARILPNRVRQYFGGGAQHVKVQAMIDNIDDFDYIITSSELEALILECNLIKQYRPYYNILLKDDKQFPYVRIDVNSKYPRVEVVRRVAPDKAKYFGPYIAAHSVKEVLDAVYTLFPLRSCKRDFSKNYRQERPCMYYQLGKCKAPCMGYISEEEYGKLVDGVMDLLSGKYQELKRSLESSMFEASEKLDFERAAIFRDKLKALKRVVEKQKVGFPNLNDTDIFAAAVGEEYSIVQAFFIRDGKLSRAEKYTLSASDSASDVLESFLKQFYSAASSVPRKIYVHTELKEEELLSDWLSQIRGSKVEILTPKKGSNKKLADLAATNAKDALDRKEKSEKREFERTKGAAQGLGDILGIGYIRRMECYDISNTQGTDSVASMVVFVDGKPDKREYRRFKIKTVEGPNDFASMKEVLTRRLLEGFKAGESENGFGAMPDLMVIDGGKGQLSSVVEILESMGLEDVNVVGLAKREEEIFLPHNSEPIVLDKSSKELKLITAIRDEAHRFAITYHRSRREKRTISSELDKIKGIGPKRRKLLIDAFGDVESISKATVEEINSVRGVDITTAKAVFKYFNE